MITQPVGLQSSGWPAQAFFPPEEMTAPRTIGSALFLPVLPSLLGLAHPLQPSHGPSHGARSLQPIRVGLCFAGRLALTGEVPLPLTRRANDGHGCNGAAQQEEKENHHEQHHTINDRPGAVLSRRRCIMPISPCRYCSGGRVAWRWTDAFMKFGFDDGDGHVMTYEVCDVLRQAGFDTEPEKWGLHNYIVDRLICPRRGELYPYENESIRIGYDNPRSYLPDDVIDLLDREFPEPQWSLREAFLRLGWALRSFIPPR